MRGSEISPFSTSPSQLHEVTLDPLSSSNDGSSGPTMKDYEAQLSHFKKENFSLKLRIYFLEERLAPYRGGSGKEDPFKKNIELKIETETLRKELLENQQLLRDAAQAMDHLEKQHKEAMQKIIDEQNAVKAQMETQIEEMKKEYEAQLEKPNHENSTAMYALAFGMPELLKQDKSLDKKMEEEFQQRIKDLEEQLSKLEKELNSEKEECGRLDLELSNSRAEKEDLEQELERCGNQISEMKGKIDDKDQELESARKQITNLEEALMAKEPEIRIKVQELSERDKMIEEANSKLEAKEKVLVEIQITLDEKQRQIEALRASLASKDEAITGLRNKLADSELATRDLQDKMKSQWMDGLSLSPKQMVQLEKNVLKKRVMSYRNHTRGLKDVPSAGGSPLPKRPGTAPPCAIGSDGDGEMLQKLQEEMNGLKKKGEETQKELQQKDLLVKNLNSDVVKLKGTLQGMSKHAKELEREYEKSKQELRRKDKKIKDLLCELTVAHDQVNRAKWEGVSGGMGRQHGMGVGFSSGLDDVNDMADEENERLWAELEDKKKKLKQVTEEKNAISTELENKVQSLANALKDKEASLAGFEDKYNSATAQLAEKMEHIQSLEAQLISLRSVNNLEKRMSCKSTSILDWVSQQSIQNSTTVREKFDFRLSSTAEEHSFLRSHIQRLQSNLRNTPERDGGPRGPLEEAEEARHEAEEIRALLGGHLWELAAFLEGLLEENSFSLPESRKSALRRALEWSRELSLSVLSTTGLGEDSERECTRTSLAMLRDFPSFCACVETACGSQLSIQNEVENVQTGEESDGHLDHTIVISEVESPKPEENPSELQGTCLSVESLHSTVEALRTRVRELEREVGGKLIDLREGSSEIGRGGNSGESVRTVRDVRSSHASVVHPSDTLKIQVGSKLEGRCDAAPLSCTPAGAIASPSESEGWSEPDRSVSLARMGLEDITRTPPSVAIVSAAQQSTPESGGSSLMETRTPSKRSHGEVRRLQNRLRGLEQVIEALRAELRVYHSMTPAAQTSVVEGHPVTPPPNNVLMEVSPGNQEGPCMKDAEVNTTVAVQAEVDAGGLGQLLDEVRCQRDKLEFSLKQNELIGQQLEGVLSSLKAHQVEDGISNLCHKLKEATERLEEEQARCRDLRNQLTSAKSLLHDLEIELKETKMTEMKLRAVIKEKDDQLKKIMTNETGKAAIALEEKSRLLSEGHSDEVCASKEEILKTCAEKEEKEEKAKSLMEKETVKGDMISQECNFDFGNTVYFRQNTALSENTHSNNVSWHQNFYGQDKVKVTGRDLFVSGVHPKQNINGNPLETGKQEKPSLLCDSLPHNRSLLGKPELKEDRSSEMENEATYLRQALKDAQERAHIEELRARKAEEEANHWMNVAKEYEKAEKTQDGMKAMEDPSECSSSSALSGILPDLSRQRSEMSDYVSDQTGGEDSEPSISRMPHQNRRSCRRPSIIPLEVSHSLTYLSPSADISPTGRHDAFSSPDLGIESDPGRFSSLENPPPKSPEAISLGNMSFAQVHSSENAIVYSNTFVENERSQRTRISTKYSGKSLDNIANLNCIKDLRLENERLRQCLSETRKNLDDTLSKLEAANRRKLNVEKAICNQLQKTHHILRKARVNLEADKKD